MDFPYLLNSIADVLKNYDSEQPIHKSFQAGIGPFGEPQIVKVIAELLTQKGIPAKTKRNPDLVIKDKWAIEIKIVRPFGDNGLPAENWSVNLLHPYPGNTSLLGDALKLVKLETDLRKAVILLTYEHLTPKIDIEPLIRSFELIAKDVMAIRIGNRVHVIREGLVHKEHQVVRCFGWEIFNTSNGS